ncbi:cyclodeaminase/cyclohydrolase family protein [Streptomyces sp. SPB074]|uniref:cyclodeaminase/cyclohydrolase family protein n=1 Tax=Streptomyces sp. (strain SPB074) TaxID=465543 RepID=UPI00017F1D2C|nr:cyclodeaminase/cyclohydrolase family protein [Streptomyces sp. SPB074]
MSESPGTHAPAPALRTAPLDTYLGRLAAREPAPGGGAAAAVHAAQGAALVAMVARYSTGPKYATHAERIAEITTETDDLRERALTLADEDAAAFTAVTDAYRLPKGTPEEKSARSGAIAAALLGAAPPPAALLSLAERIVSLAEELLPLGNPNVVTDVAAAAEAARAAASTARVNVEINLGGIKDTDARERLTTTLGRTDPLLARAEAVTAEVRRRLEPENG